MQVDTHAQGARPGRQTVRTSRPEVPSPEEAIRRLDEVDLKDVAHILQRVYPGLSLCACARLAAGFAPEEASTCSLCKPGTFPACVRRRD